MSAQRERVRRVNAKRPLEIRVRSVPANDQQEAAIVKLIADLLDGTFPASRA